ncbi:unnamed protein product [Darwinula stevensoni]|uniref:cellulase n=1 Tax=Darwinula stevensoni TaxID=69355 RepID=A0A7R8X7I6_9CRUS|nr:unnamed protein product [Darwinula stevensoni]CAG0886961.1 unnamed protein product [Darwinula stevensoni]
MRCFGSPEFRSPSVVRPPAGSPHPRQTLHDHEIRISRLPNLLLLLLAFLGMSQVKGDYDYASAIRLSYKFYEAQRAGQLPDNHIPWRKSSFLNDGRDKGINLVGGYFDAGDYVKFGFPMAYTTTVLAWGMVEYANAYNKAGLAAAGRAQLRWATDYFIKAHPSAKKLFGQVGKGDVDHSYWGRPEDWPSNMERPSYFIDEDSPGSDLAAETAAAMAASSMVFRGNDDTYANTLLRHARELYAFADENRGLYSDSITDAQEFYPSSAYEDELAWAAAWLYRATRETSYLNDAERKYVEFGLDDRPSEFSWDDKNAGVQVLLAVLTGKTKYKTAVKTFCDYMVNEVPRTPKGLVFIQKWGVLRHAANVAYVCLVFDVHTSKVVILYDMYFFLVFFCSSCPTVQACGGCQCSWSYFYSPNPNPNLLEGALVGGPDKQDRFKDDRHLM